jgi:hypothetical protein
MGTHDPYKCPHQIAHLKKKSQKKKRRITFKCNIKEPYSIYYKEHAKWKAWNSIKGMTIEDAMKEYINYYKNYIYIN